MARRVIPTQLRQDFDDLSSKNTPIEFSLKDPSLGGKLRKGILTRVYHHGFHTCGVCPKTTYEIIVKFIGDSGKEETRYAHNIFSVNLI
jgi:hypothetical protein